MEQNLRTKILLSNNLLEMKQANSALNVTKPSENDTLVATVLSNLSYYGYVPSLDVVANLKSSDSSAIKEFWKTVEPSLKEITGDNKNMGDFVVYKNFPKEVLEKSQAEYWLAQVLMYWGFKNELFTQPVESRSQMLELKSLKVLSLADDNSLGEIYTNLIKSPARWTESQKEYAQALMSELKISSIDLDVSQFKENTIALASKAITQGLEIKVSTATDVLRLASAMSDGDVSLRTNVKFRNFKRPERKMLLSLLDNSTNLMADVGVRPEVFKRLFKALHPGDYKFQNVIAVYDNLYKDNYTTLNSEIDAKIANKDISVLNIFKSRPGEYVRKLHHLYSVFKEDAVDSFIDVVPQLKTIQLVKLSKYIETINDRKELIFAPGGNWTKAQFEKNEKEPFSQGSKDKLLSSISDELSNRLTKQFPQGVSLGEGLDKIKLQTNDQELATYGRGTEFPIPENMNFIRTASYWACKTAGSNWFDNGWNFFDKDWKDLDTCCWNTAEALNKGAIFSGDPTNAKDMEGRACQMIDLNIDALVKSGARYAVWNILSFSHVAFKDADVMGTLQWGEDAQSGKLYEPSRAQMVFPVQGDNYTKYVAYVDLVERSLVYMDANLYGNVSSAQDNASKLSEKMPAFVEYLDSLPSVQDLFKHAPKGITPILYTDKDVKVEEQAYVFKPENTQNSFTQIDLANVLSHEATEPKKKKKM
jgi:predicted heme/steroid binding protein